MLKIKVGTYLAVLSNYSHNSGSHQGMSEAKVEKIKVGEHSSHICAPRTAHTFIGSGAQNNCGNFHSLSFDCPSKSQNRDPPSRRVLRCKKGANGSWQSAQGARP